MSRVFFTTLILLDSNWEIPLLLNEAEWPLLVKYRSMIGLIASLILSVAVMQCADSNIPLGLNVTLSRTFGDKNKHSALPDTIFIKDAWNNNWELSLYLSSLTMSVSQYSWVLIIYAEEHFRSDLVVQHLYSLKGQLNDLWGTFEYMSTCFKSMYSSSPVLTPPVKIQAPVVMAALMSPFPKTCLSLGCNSKFCRPPWTEMSSLGRSSCHSLVIRWSSRSGLVS